MSRSVLVAILALGLVAPGVVAQEDPGADPPQAAEIPFPYAKPEEVGLSSEALADLAGLVRGWTRDTLVVGAEILVVKNGRAVLHEAIGWSDLEAREPMRKHSIFRLLAPTKPFTGTAALMLVEEGRLGLDAPVSRWLASWANERSGEITVRQLLTHTAGWEQYGTPRPLESYRSLRAMVDDVGRHGPQHPPGGAYRYSDVHSYALGALVGEVSGMPVERFIEERILEPLGLDDTHTRFAPDTAWAHRVNSRYHLEDGAWTKVWSPDQPQADSFFRASGGLFSTAMDYARWLEAWMAWAGPATGASDEGPKTGEGAVGGLPRLLSRRTVRSALTPTSGPNGMHWEILSDDPLVFGHGGVDGTHAMAVSSLDVIVVYLTQSQGREMRGRWTRAALDAVAPGLQLHRPLASTPVDKDGLEVVELTPSERARYAGSYLAAAHAVRILEEDGRLRCRLPTAGAPLVSLVPLGDHTFAMGRYEGDEPVEILLPLQRLRFVMEDGRATKLALMHDGEVRVVLSRAELAADTVHVAPPTGKAETDDNRIEPRGTHHVVRDLDLDPWPADAPPDDTVRYVGIVNGMTGGERLMWRDGPNAWGYMYDMGRSGFPRTERVVLDEEGLPLKLDVSGQKAPWDGWAERFERQGDSARWTTTVDEGKRAVEGSTFYAAIHPAHDPGVLARALLRRPSRRLPLLPAGEATLEALGERAVERHGRNRTVRHYAVHGLDLKPAYVWLDESGATFADEWTIRAGWESVFPELKAASQAALADHVRGLARRLMPPSRDRPLAIRGARLFDPATGAVRPGKTILIEGNRVAAIGDDGDVQLPEGAEMIDAAGRTVLPGLWDMHAHHGTGLIQFFRSRELDAPLHLAGGVTTARDLGSHTDELLSLRRRVASGEAIGPRLLAAGYIDGVGGSRTGVQVGTPEEARAAVDRFAELGYVQIKIYDQLPAELVRVVIERADRHGLRVSGHVPRGMSAREAVGAGFDELQHVERAVNGILGSLDELSVRWGEDWAAWADAQAALQPGSEPVQDFIDLLAARDVALDPTLTLALAREVPPHYIAPVLDRFPPQARRRLLDRFWSRPPEVVARWDQYVSSWMGFVHAAHEAGIRILPGTDLMPGFGLHRELELYVEAGIPAPEVLRLATLGAARAMSMDDELGTVEPGKLADLILVDGDPTEEIGDIRRVVTVIKDGRVYDPAAIYRAFDIEHPDPDPEGAETGDVADTVHVAPGTYLMGGDSSNATSLAITPVGVIDVRKGVTRSGQTVVVDGDEIAVVGPVDSVEIPAEARVVDGTGKYLIPGLWDMHVHSVSNVAIDMEVDSVAAMDWHFPLFVAHGVTGVRNMGDAAGDAALELTNAARRRLADGQVPGPRFLAAGPSVDGDPPLASRPVVVRTATEARAVVDSLADPGADFVKVYENLSREAYFAIVDQARRRGLPVDGHVPFRVKPGEAADAGQRTVEHPEALAAGCSTGDDAAREWFSRVLAERDRLPEEEQFLAQFRYYRSLYDSWDPAACAPMFEAYRRNGVALAADLVAYHHVVHAKKVLADTTAMRLVPAPIRRNWQASLDSEIVEDFQAILRPIVPDQAEQIRRFHEAGGTLLAATDVGVPWQVPGLSLHANLALLVEAGLTTAEGLRAATLNPARVLGLADSLGTVETGKLADLVLLDANPLEDITHTREIAAVLLDGRYLDRAALDEILKKAERAANRSSDATRDPLVPEDRPPAGETDTERLARQVVIYRDTHGVPHVHGRTDEAAVFGLAYARAEDQFELIEHIFLNRLGRASEVYGEEGLLTRDFARGRDLLIHAYRYGEASREAWSRLPGELRGLIEAYTAGLNYYLENHPEQETRLLDQFEPWWVLAVEDASESYRGMVHAGAFGADPDAVMRGAWRLPERGSNAWAVGPGRTASGNAMLFVNPHDPSRFPYYECHVMSDEGLNSYGVMNYFGALLLPYIGFNEHLGWTVTVNEPDLGDAYEMTFDHPTDPSKYRFGEEFRTAETWDATVRVRDEDNIESLTVPFMRTIHGPVLATSEDGAPTSFRIARSPSGTLTEQLYRMHKATSLEEWKEGVALRGLTYHNLMYADRAGHIFYLYNGNVPVRDDSFDWTQPVDGSDPRTLWQEYHEIDELPQLLNPDTGYLQNANSSPFVATHAGNLDPADYPRYMTSLENGDTYRARRSRQLLRSASSVTLDELQRMATSSHLYAADEWLPLLFAEWDSVASDDPLRERLREPMAALKRWNRKSSPASIETTLFVLWDEAYWLRERDGQRRPLVSSLADAVDILEAEFGTWKVPWRDVFRHQRRADGDAVYWDESRPSQPTSGNHGRYGAMFNMRGEPYDGTRESVKRRMTFGNSFVSIVEFTSDGPVARSIVAYGNSSRPESPHYDDQAAMFARGGMKPVLFEMEDILANLEESYRPGEREEEP